MLKITEGAGCGERERRTGKGEKINAGSNRVVLIRKK